VTDARVHGEAVEVLGTGTPSAQVHGEAVEVLGSVPADVRVHAVVVEVLGTYIGPPNSPENVSGTPYVFSADLTWEAPAAGYPVAYYEVRADGGPWTFAGLSLSHRFAGLAADTDYLLEVRAVNNGGASAPASDTVHTFASADTPPGYYRVEVSLGSHDYVAALGDTPERGVVLPVTLGWAMPDEVEYFPAPPDPTALTFRLLVDDIADIADVVKGTPVSFRMFVQVDEEAEPWQEFDGVVTQLKANRVEHDGGATLVSVFAGDDRLGLNEEVIGYSADWPQETIFARVARICAEAGITWEYVYGNSGMDALLGARTRGPITVLSALRDTLKDVAARNTSEPPGTYFGRYVLKYWERASDAWGVAARTLRTYALYRRVYPDQVIGGTTYPGSTVTLDGGLVEARGEWTKVPRTLAPTWGVVDGTTFGTPDGTPPFYKSTSWVDVAVGYNPTSVSRNYLGNSLLPDGSTQLSGWYAREVTYRMLGGPDPVTGELVDHLADVLLVRGWAAQAPILELTPVVIDDVDARYRLNGEAYLAGTLTGARLVIPPGGRFYMTLRLRPELIPGTELP
jgi:hypothetical protein